MRKTIEEITRASQLGYIEDYRDVDEIITRLSEMRLSQFPHGSSDNILKLMRFYMEDNNLDVESCAELTYGETLGIIFSLPVCKVYKETTDAKWGLNMRLTLLGHVSYMMISACSCNTALHLFMSVSVSGYFRYLAAKAGRHGKETRRPFRRFSKSIRQSIGFRMSGSTTIKELLLKLDMFLRKCWTPNQPIEEFQASVRAGYDDLYCFFIAYFKEAFPEYFDVDKLKEKYSVKTELTEEK